MTDRSRSWFMPTMAALIALAVLGFALGIWLEGRLDSIEVQTLERAPDAEPLQTLETRPAAVATRQTVYVPVYSHIYHRGGRSQPLETTLSIRNTDPDLPLLIDSVRYYNTGGELVRDYLTGSVILPALASADFLVQSRDMSGGVGANFLVEWSAEDPVNEPLIEAVMVGVSGNQAFSFVGTGRVIDEASADD